MKQIILKILKEISILILSVVVFSIFTLITQIILGILGELGALNFLDSFSIFSTKTGALDFSFLISLLFFLIVGLPNRKYKSFFRDTIIICLVTILITLYLEATYKF